MTLRQREITGAIAIMVIVSFYLHLTTQIDLAFSSELETIAGPRAYPRIILVIMGALCVLLLIQSWFAQPKETSEETGEKSLVSVVLAILMLCIFASAFEPVGYIFTVPPLVFAAALLNRARNWKSAALTALISTACLLIIFRYGLNIVLPEGLLGIDWIF
ncbi:tripartite tricarboxylate transporter TctB family protein [Candidatus Njordibacter sp. Uisw_039]|jgi:putative tricarboxylic transport membrane protein|uniref:tripartite tricarboxylate transporter TctB family protein n=1 Tax=Candidatus Njordibacter sp. Uisw_039 TaxID=3230972 RepID=UPI003D58F373|tara:strand:- start:3875 stop:4357 length:483 start_codon:yes stop_codon:yes gene_type:complete